MENTETKQPEEQVVITYNDKQYRASDLNEEQMAIAAKLNVAGRKLARLQEAYDDYCLLYTSPSPRDGLLSRMPSSA